MSDGYVSSVGASVTRAAPTPGSPRERASARERVAEKARAGRAPDDNFPLADLEWAFRDHEAELEAHRIVAADVAASRAARRDEVRQGREVRAMTETVLREWDEQAQAERRAAATAEAVKRLGLEATT